MHKKYFARVWSHLSLYYIDILNCLINDHNCSQICVEEEGSFSCSCSPGYDLQDDLATCEGNKLLQYCTCICCGCGMGMSDPSYVYTLSYVCTGLKGLIASFVHS